MSQLWGSHFLVDRNTNRAFRSAWTVGGRTDQLTLTHNLPSVAFVGDAFAHIFSATGGLAPYTFFQPFGMLPPGLKLNAGSGALAGIPTIKGKYSFTIEVLDGKDIQEQVECSITIKGRPLFT